MTNDPCLLLVPPLYALAVALLGELADYVPVLWAVGVCVYTLAIAAALDFARWRQARLAHRLNGGAR